MQKGTRKAGHTAAVRPCWVSAEKVDDRERPRARDIAKAGTPRTDTRDMSSEAHVAATALHASAEG